MVIIVKKNVKRKGFMSNPFLFIDINTNMKNSQESGKFKIICIRVPKWLAFILKRFVKEKQED